MSKIIFGDPFQILREYGAVYDSPVKDGHRVGPMVMYAGIDPKTKKNFVGYIYFNIARAEQPFKVRQYFSNLISRLIIDEVGTPDTIISAPMGGITFGVSIANILQAESAFLEKIVTVPGDLLQGIKEKSKLALKRHKIEPKARVVIMEDVCNNFSTTNQMIKEINQAGAEVIAIACIFNRSELTHWNNIPVIAAIDEPNPEYTQDDPEVLAFLASGGTICSDVKAQWNNLQKIMNNA